MKSERLCLLSIPLLLLASCGGSSSSSEEASSSAPPTEGLSYSLSRDGSSYALMGLGESEESEIVVPSTYEDLPVTSIGKGAFEDTSITSISLPSSVTYIGEEAFKGCSSLRNVYMTTSIEEIASTAFDEVSYGLVISYDGKRIEYGAIFEDFGRVVSCLDGYIVYDGVHYEEDGITYDFSYECHYEAGTFTVTCSGAWYIQNDISGINASSIPETLFGYKVSA